MRQLRKIYRGLTVPCAICGNPTRYKGSKFGYKCYNLKCNSKKLNKINWVNSKETHDKCTKTHGCVKKQLITKQQEREVSNVWESKGKHSK